MKLLLPDSIALDLTLPGDVDNVRYAVDQPIPAAHTDAEALVVWGNPAGQLADAARRLTRLRWVQTLAAGPDAVLAAGFGPEVVITAGTGLHDRTVAEHALALALAAARRLNLLVRAQIGHRWASELGGLQPVHQPVSFRTLRDARVAVWGFGGIAATLSPLLAALGAQVTGIARHPGERHGFPVVTASGLPETAHALDAEVLALLPAHAWLVNVGRGSTVDETALLAALRAGRLGGAALDVTEREPLPAGSGLWDEPSVIITPHAAGGRPLGAAERITENLAALLAGAPLRDVVTR
jgi:phosphoglycerate dehydrogenase-like enzyme